MRLTFLMALCLLPFYGQAQDMTALQQTLTEKQEALAISKNKLDTLAKDVADLEKSVAQLINQITPYPRWTKGLFGNVGFSMANYSDWLTKEVPSVSSANIGIALNVFANLEQKKYYWKNTAQLNLGWIKFDDKDDDEDEEGFKVAADAFQFTSLIGYKLSEKIALSSILEYRTSLLDGKFNNPGYLDFGSLGLTWTPSNNLTLSFHSLSYNFIISDDGLGFDSSFGAKAGGDYIQQLPVGIAWKSNLSSFISYKDVNELSNWIWTNTFTTAVKGIGVGLTLGLKGSRQEAKALGLEDNPLQSFWLLGLTYNL